MAAVKAFDAGTGLDNKEAAATATVAATQAESACDAAREATFPFLEDSNTASYASHASAYAAASLLYAEALLLQHELQTAAERQEAGSGKTKKSGKGKKANSKAPSNAEAVGKAALRALDLAMLRGGVNDWAPHAAPLVQSATALLGEPATSDAPKSTPVAHDPLTAATADAADADAVAAANTAAEARCPQWLCGEADAHCTRIERVDARTLTPESFAALYMGAGTSDGSGNNNRSLPKPVVLTHALEAWPALKRWPDMAYLRRAAGVSDRLVPVETCSDADASQTYMSDSWQQVICEQNFRRLSCLFSRYLSLVSSWVLLCLLLYTLDGNPLFSCSSQRVMSFGDYIDKYMVPSPISMEGAARGAFGDEDDDGSVDADDDDDDDADDDEEEEEDDFEDDYEDDDDEARGYLAQHPLFDQVPSLRNDIVEPSLCAAVCPEDLKAPANCEVRLSKKTTASIVNSVAVGKAASSASKTATDNNKKADKEKEGQEEVMGPLVSAWFGPSGTVSPLHNDPYHNLLCQVIHCCCCCYCCCCYCFCYSILVVVVVVVLWSRMHN